MEVFILFGEPTNTGGWNLDIALAIFPVVQFFGAGINENVLGAKIYPNPANNILNFKLNSNASSIEVLTMEGKVLISSVVNVDNGSIDISSLDSGIYMYQITSENGTKSSSTFVKK